MERADIAILNPGGLRSDIDAGELTYGKVYETLPFDDEIARVELTGEELLRLLRVAYGDRRGIFPVSGLKIQLSPCPGPNRFRGATLSDGAAILPQKIYRIVLPDFLARGGDGLGVVLGSIPSDRINLHPRPQHTLRDELIAFWQKRNRHLRAPQPDRIFFSAESGSCAEASSSLNVRSDH
jgi:5'-nucleotidase